MFLGNSPEEEKYLVELLKLDEPEINWKSNQLQDRMNRAIEELSRQHSAQLEQHVVNALEKHGYTFLCQESFYKFLRDNSTLVRSQEKNTLFINGVPMVEWWDTVRYEFEGNMVKAIYGEPR